MHPIFAGAAAPSIPILFADSGNLAKTIGGLDATAQAFARAAGYEAKPGEALLVPGEAGKLAAVLFGIETPDAARDLFLPAKLVALLPPGTYHFGNRPHDARLAALAFALGAYQFSRYRTMERRDLRLVVPEGVDGDDLTRIVEAVTLCRDLINTPSNDMGPAELEDAARKVAGNHGAAVQVTAGKKLEKDFPLIHVVGAGAEPNRAPRLIDFVWGDERHPKVTLLGKGVCFDTGGLNIKGDAGMLNMKKDLGGAATALALAHMVMSRKLKLRLRVLIPAVENAISGGSFRPRDVYTSRKGVTVEIGNTDAEGRLILADALALADSETPELIIDFATLTGAARVALGPDVPAAFTDDDALAGELMRFAAAENDPVWRLPLWRPYTSLLESKVADINNVGSGGHAGAITAALFLRRFVEAKSWLHFDIFAWTGAAKPARPEGGECQTARALYALLAARYG